MAAAPRTGTGAAPSGQGRPVPAAGCPRGRPRTAPHTRRLLSASSRRLARPGAPGRAGLTPPGGAGGGSAPARPRGAAAAGGCEPPAGGWGRAPRSRAPRGRIPPARRGGAPCRPPAEGRGVPPGLAGRGRGVRPRHAVGSTPPRAVLSEERRQNGAVLAV